MMLLIGQAVVLAVLRDAVDQVEVMAIVLQFLDG